MNKTVLGALILIFTVSCKKNVDYSVASVKMSDYKINKVLLDSTAINGGITTSFVYPHFTTMSSKGKLLFYGYNQIRNKIDINLDDEAFIGTPAYKGRTRWHSKRKRN